MVRKRRPLAGDGDRDTGRKRLTEPDLELRTALERLIDPVTCGDPTSPLRWTGKSPAGLAEQLTAAGHPVSERTVNRLLHELGYRLQTNRKTLERRQHVDRDAQFDHINERCQEFQEHGRPVISVDTKKKELIEFKVSSPLLTRDTRVADPR